MDTKELELLLEPLEPLLIWLKENAHPQFELKINQRTTVLNDGQYRYTFKNPKKYEKFH